MLKIICFALILMFFTGCDKPNPEPEKLDPIYSELEKEAANVENEMKKAEKDLEGFEKDAKAVVPQTGQRKYAEKRVFEAKDKLEKLSQQKKYWEIKLESRKNWDRSHYLSAYNKKETWPDPKEFEEYQIQRKLELAPRNWDAKRRLEDSRSEFGPKTSKPEHAEESEGKSASKDHH
jgi:hypothetical protein